MGRGGVALRLHVVYKGRARPLGGPVRQGPQGPWPAAMPRALVEPLHALLPPGAQGVVLGAGAGAGPPRPQPVQDDPWAYVGRTGSPRTGAGDGARFRCETGAAGPRRLLGGWAPGEKAPLDVRTHMDAAAEACRLSTTRLCMATVFSDQTSRGCHLHQAHLANPMRLTR